MCQVDSQRVKPYARAFAANAAVQARSIRACTARNTAVKSGKNCYTVKLMSAGVPIYDSAYEVKMRVDLIRQRHTVHLS